MIADTDIQRAAEELVERYGDNALTVAQERAKAHTTSQDQSGLNIALRVLSAVETLLASEGP
jgi:hypothetical protein